MKCKHVHKDAPDNAICQDCYLEAKNSECSDDEEDEE